MKLKANPDKKYIEDEFDWYKRKDGTWYIRHKLARSGEPEYRKVRTYYDSGCRNYQRYFGISDIDRLIQHKNQEIKWFYPSSEGGYLRMQQEHTILKILRNWRELYWKYGYEVHKTGLSSQILTRSQEDSSYLWSELTPDGEYFEVKHDNTLLEYNEIKEYKYYEPTGLKAWGEFDYYNNLDDYISGNASKSGEVFMPSGSKYTQQK